MALLRVWFEVFVLLPKREKVARYEPDEGGITAAQTKSMCFTA
jgi:hypothetical protein